MEKIRLKIRVKHLIESRFVSNCNCGIANALKDQLNLDNSDVNVGIDFSFIKGMEYSHEFYGADNYNDDKHKATISKNPDKIIRTIILTYQYDDRSTI